MRGFRGDLFSVKSQDNNEYIIAQSSNIGNDSLNNRNRWLCKIPSDVKKLNDRTQLQKIRYKIFFGRIRAMHTYTVLSNVLNLQDQNLQVVQIAIDHRIACRLPQCRCILGQKMHTHVQCTASYFTFDQS